MTQPFTEMEMRVAKAIADAGPTSDEVRAHPEYEERVLELSLDLARAAIRAMREPTECMCTKHVHGENFAASGLLQTWQAMIDAASPPEVPA